MAQILTTYESRYGPRTLRIYSNAAFIGVLGTDIKVIFVKYQAGYIYYDIFWRSTGTNIMIEFGAHIAQGVDGLSGGGPGSGTGWGPGQGASDISGGPYHVILEDFQILPPNNGNSPCEGNMGNQDNQLQGSQVILVPNCNVSGPPSPCANATGLVYHGNVTNVIPTSTYNWSFFGANTSGATFAGVTNDSVVTVNAGPSAGSFTLRFIVTNPGDFATADTCFITTQVQGGPAVVCPQNSSIAACSSQAAINAAYAAWLASASGGSTNNSTGPPPLCGGTVTVTFTATNQCGSSSCTASFTVDPAPAVVLNCAANTTLAACTSQANINSAYAAWLASATATGGCNRGAVTNNGGAAPNACTGGTNTVTFTVTSTCETKTCSATFTVPAAPAVVLNCAANTTLAACTSQADVNAAYAAWLASATATGGCNRGAVTNNGGAAPNACTGGTNTVTFTVTSTCETKTCSATFTVPAAPAVVLTCAVNTTLAACTSQADVNAAYAAWLASATATGGCARGAVTNNGGAAPNACTGGTNTVTFTVTSTCETKTCSATFTVPAAPAVVLTCAVNTTLAACTSQADVNAAYAAWLASATATGGCNRGAVTNNGGAAPNACTGGTNTVTFTVTSTCETKTCSATFTVPAAPAVVLTCAVNTTLAACTSQANVNAAYAAWLASATATGGCNRGAVTNNGGAAPNACTGGTNTVTFTVTSTCETKTCSATFTVPAAPAVVLTCAVNTTLAACTSQANVNAAYAAWLASATATGGCNRGAVTNNGGAAPNACTGGTNTVTFTVTSTCETKTCSATFTVPAAPAVVLTCAVNTTLAACTSQADVNAAYAAWLASATATGGCNRGAVTNNGGAAPNACTGGTNTVTFTVTSTCETKTCSATFTVPAAPAVVLTCAVNTTLAACTSQADVNAAYAAWLASATATGGCNRGAVTNNGGAAPNACTGGTNTVTFTVTSTCETKTCSATFTVPAAPAVVLTCAVNTTLAACTSQADVNAAYAAWLASATATGGCNRGAVTNNGGAAPNACTGGTNTVTFTVTSTCETKTCSATFTVPAAPAVVLNCAVNTTLAACTSQADVNAAYAAWLASATATGGCARGAVTNNGGAAPNACTGGTNTVTFTVTSTCETKTCSATFTVPAAPAVVLTCAVNTTLAACTSQANVNAAYAAWLASATATGGCNRGAVTNNGGAAPNACTGGTNTVTFTVTSTCETKTCSATFTVPAAPAVVLTCAVNTTLAACTSQADVNAAYAAWLASATATGGCNRGAVTNNGGAAPNACTGGTNTVTFTVTSTCETKTCSATFTVPAAPAVVLTCAVNTTLAACTSQADVNAAYAAWLASATATGGCNRGAVTNNGGAAPNACTGGTNTVTFTVTSTCETKTCSATFTVPAAPAVVLTCAVNTTLAACTSQANVNAAYTAWLASATATGGCNRGAVTNNGGAAPNACTGGTNTVTFTVTSTCETKTCSATFTVPAAPAVVLTCAVNTTLAACTSQADVNAAYAAWLASATATGGCNRGAVTNNGGAAPNACTGGTNTVTFTVTSTCETKTCSATFTVPAAPAVVLTCAVNTTLAACTSQADVNAAYAAWLASATATGGCNRGAVTNNGGAAPNACTGGTNTVTFTVTSTCETKTCSATFTVPAAPAVVLTCAVNTTLAACTSQADVNAAYAAWLASATATGGCNRGAVTNNGGAAPNACTGGTNTVTFTVTSTCETKTCSATFTVPAAPAVVLTCAVNTTLAACTSQANVNAAYAAWLASATATGGCNRGAVTNNGGAAPNACTGGTNTVTFTVTSTCETKTCSATFTVPAAPAVVLTCAVNTTLAACTSQADVNAAYAAWLASATATGGCNRGAVTNNGGAAPNACTGGTNTVTFTVTSTCETKTCSATFTVPAAPAVVLTCAVNTTLAACTSQADVNAAYAAWLASATATGGCNRGAVTNNGGAAPNACTGGTNTVTFTVTSTCETKTCSATFTVPAAPAVVLTCAVNTTLAACTSQADVNAAYAAWLASATATGGCNRGAVTNNGGAAPNACTGGTNTVTFTVTSTCETKTCSATFTVPAAPAVVLTCAVNTTLAACTSQANVNAAYAAWLASATATGGCNRGAVTNNGGAAPNACTGGTNTVTFTVTSTCETKTCSATFTVPAAPAVVLTCAVNTTLAACTSQADVNAAYAAWLASATATGGCNRGAVTNNGGAAPNACTGGTNTVTFTVTSTCETKTCSATFTVPAAPAVVLTCAVNTTLAACTSQADVNAAYAVWLASANATGGCNRGAVTNNGGAAPNACTGGTNTVTFTVTSTCETKTCSATFTVPAAPAVVLTCAVNTTLAACTSQADVNAAYAAWLASATATGGCNRGAVTNNGGAAPNACTGGTNTVTFTVTSTCETKTCSATFTVPAAPAVVLTCAVNTTLAACTSQANVNAAYAAWLASATATGGCNRGAVTNNGGAAPNACTGGTNTVTFTVTSTCETKTCSATFTVPAAPAVVLTCAVNTTLAACTSQADVNAAYAAWLASATATGGCNRGAVTNNGGAAPNACTGGTNTVTFTVTSTCETKTCSATFTVPAAPAVVLTCAVNTTLAACTSQANVNAAYAAWLASATATGGCNRGAGDELAEPHRMLVQAEQIR